MADREPVGFGRFENVIRRNHAPGSRHVFDDDRRVAWNVFAHVAADRSGIGIVAAAWSKTDDHADGLAIVEGRLGVDPRVGENENAQKNEQGCGQSRWLLKSFPHRDGSFRGRRRFNSGLESPLAWRLML